VLVQKLFEKAALIGYSSAYIGITMIDASGGYQVTARLPQCRVGLSIHVQTK
jgi:hypothetical protein